MMPEVGWSIGLDAHMVGEQETGNETYVLGLMRGLAQLDAEALAGLRMLYYHPDPERLRAPLPAGLHAGVRALRPAQSLLRIPFGLPAAARRDRLDLLHVTYIGPPVRVCPTMVTVHDISYEVYPEYFSPRDLRLLRSLVPFTLRRAAGIITVSEFSKREIVARYGVPGERITVTYEAAGERFTPIAAPGDAQRLLERYDLHGGYLLALGNLQPRKNLSRLVEAYARARAAGALRGVPLVLAGKAKWRESELFRTVEQRGLSEDVCFPGYIADEDLPALYRGAVALVYPSVYEGFGLPPLEAMASGAAVVCSTAASLPEVVGDAALNVDPQDTEALAQALVDVVAQPALRAALQKAGPRRAGQFTWRRCAEETVEAYRRILGARR